ncbi:MAG: glycosyltransferase [Bacteroidetes bacterium]|nr:glycosyltransferase [Bacteroidota bacterium]MBU1115814.1 glycosyltransferase [Bacteroidota bacterium]MBU1800207.1 glycosyltransferase [Bacteroidota bacterium]
MKGELNKNGQTEVTQLAKKKKSVTISFLGNANYDTRVTNLTNSLVADGFEVKVISFDWTTPNFQTVIGDTSIFKLVKQRNSIPYYFKYLSILFKEISKTNSSIYIAEDIFTLPVVTFFAKLRKAKLYYNSREFYAFLAGLRNKPRVQSIISNLEKFFIKKTDKVLVTGDGDAEFLQGFYNLNNTVVIRNLPLKQKAFDKKDFRKMLGIPETSTIMLYQGVILEGRGFEPLLNSMKNVKNCDLVVLGTGVFQEKYEKIANDLCINNRVHFLGNIEQKELINYTSAADIGIALIENISKSYYYALPNKLFEYIMAELPVLISDLPQMKKIVLDYRVGEIVSLENSDEIANKLEEFISDKNKLSNYKKNTIAASEELNWQSEYEKVKHIFD